MQLPLGVPSFERVTVFLWNHSNFSQILHFALFYSQALRFCPSERLKHTKHTYLFTSITHKTTQTPFMHVLKTCKQSGVLIQLRLSLDEVLFSVLQVRDPGLHSPMPTRMPTLVPELLPCQSLELETEGRRERSGEGAIDQQ